MGWYVSVDFDRFLPLSGYVAGRCGRGHDARRWAGVRLCADWCVRSDAVTGNSTTGIRDQITRFLMGGVAASDLRCGTFKPNKQKESQERLRQIDKC